MNSLEVNGKILELNDFGFLCQIDEWNEDVALALAKTERIDELREDHWKILHYLRDYYKRKAITPKIKTVCHDNGMSLRELYDLFPSGPAKGAMKIAGLPEPASCA